MQPCRHAAPSAVPPTWLAVANRPAVLDHSDRWLPAARAAGEPVEAWREGREGEGVCSGVRLVWISCLRYSLRPDSTERDGLSASCSGHWTLAPLRPSPHILTQYVPGMGVSWHAARRQHPA